MNDNSQSQNLIKIPRCIWQLDRTAAVMVMAPEIKKFAILFTSGLSESQSGFGSKPKLKTTVLTKLPI